MSDSDLAGRLEGYRQVWSCIGKTDQRSTENLVVTLWEMEDSPRKHYLIVNRIDVYSDSGSLATHTKGLYAADTLEVIDDEGSTVIYIGSSGLTLDSPIASLNKKENVLLLTLPSGLYSPTSINCSTKEFLD